MSGIQFVNARSPEEAASIAEDGGLPAQQEYHGDSFEVIDVRGVWDGEVTP